MVLDLALKYLATSSSKLCSKLRIPTQKTFRMFQNRLKGEWLNDSDMLNQLKRMCNTQVDQKGMHRFFI